MRHNPGSVYSPNDRMTYARRALTPRNEVAEVGMNSVCLSMKG